MGTESSLEAIFAPVKGEENLAKKRFFGKLTPVCLCQVREDEESDCTGFLAGQDGKCCWRKEVEPEFKICRQWVEELWDERR